MTSDVMERFFSKVDKNGPIPKHQPGLGRCHIWKAGVNAEGYGRFHLEGRGENAHRVAFWLANGVWPKFHILHRCDNPPCVNHAHLFEGSNEDNVADRTSKRRSAKLPGTLNGMAKLSEQKVQDIRASYVLCKVSHRELAKQFGVSKTLIGNITRKEGWAHV